MTPTKTEIFNRAADLLEEFGWCKHAPARDDEGYSCVPQSPHAVTFCLTGAVERAILDLCGWDIREHDGLMPPPFKGRARPLSEAEGNTPLDPHWNNASERTREEVISRLRDLGARYEQVEVSV